MTPQRSIFVSAAAILICLSGPAAAQADDGKVLSDMRECARIAEISARVACYDRNVGIPVPAASGAASVVPAPSPARPPRTRAAVPSPSGLGAETVRRAPAATPVADEVTARLVAVTQRAPGLYLFTLEDGAQWRFANSERDTYVPPRPGSTVEIRRGTLGSFLMRYNDQPSIRVIRMR